MDVRDIYLVLTVRLPFICVANRVVPLKIQHAGFVDAVFTIFNCFRYYNRYLLNQGKYFVCLMYLWYRHLLHKRKYFMVIGRVANFFDTQFFFVFF